ncbi:hypothetical protein [Bartonella choladocola]|uniref:hypothetical protein n=1 Tax=Bartonella choladocola TaxID=2750995 RepID=UPI003B52475E
MLRAKHEGASCVGQIIASDWFSRQAISRVRPSLTSRRFTLQAGRIDEASFQLPVLSSIPDCSTNQDYAVRKNPFHPIRAG